MGATHRATKIAETVSEDDDVQRALATVAAQQVHPETHAGSRHRGEAAISCSTALARGLVGAPAHDVVARGPVATASRWYAKAPVTHALTRTVMRRPSLAMERQRPIASLGGITGAAATLTPERANRELSRRSSVVEPVLCQPHRPRRAHRHLPAHPGTVKRRGTAGVDAMKARAGKRAHRG